MLRSSIAIAAASLALAAFARPAGSGSNPDGTLPAARSSDALLIRNVHVLPMTRDTVLRDHAVRIVDGTIDRIAPAGELVPAEGDVVVEGEGRYLLPGLVDFHVHIRDDSELVSYLAFGVTAVVNLRGSPEHLELARAVAAGEVLGPTIVTSGPLVDGDPPIWSGSGTVVVTNSTEAREAVAAQARAGYDLIKTYNNLAPEALRAAVEEAEAHGLAVVGHIPRNPERATALQKALDAGMAMIPHAEEIFFTYLGGAGDAGMRGAPPSVDPARIREAARLVAESGAAVTPNLSFVAMTARMLEDLDGVFEHPEAAYLEADVMQMWRAQNPTRRDDLERFAAREAVKGPAVRTLTLELQRMGVPLLVGTDASGPGLYPGWSAILDIEELVAAGLSPFEALAAATRTAGEFLARNVAGAPAIGTIETGKRADLVLVEGNPLAGMSTLREPVGVVLRGRWLPRAELESTRAIVR